MVHAVERRDPPLWTVGGSKMAPWLTAARRCAIRAAAPFYRHQLFRWYWAEVDQPTGDQALPDGFELVHGTEADLPLLAQVGADFDRARDFLAAGHRLWLVRNGDTLAFSTWTFLGSAPSGAARTGWLALPEATANQEDANTHPDFRGQGLAGAASRQIAAELARECGIRRGVAFMLDDNASSRRAAAKSGSREFAVVDLKKFGFLRRDSDWRSRRGDGPFVVTKLRVEQSAVDGERLPGDDEMFAWLRSATRKPVPGPQRGAGAVQEPVAPVESAS
jgi:GNAT superfamily N-acetyltransferase